MGPRSWDRGEYAVDANAATSPIASMGPRCWGRGEGVDEGLAKPIGIGFNGAAVLGPRRVPFVSARVVPVMPLQWGRGLGTAESGDARGHSFASPLASMGPRSWDRGEAVACGKAPP